MISWKTKEHTATLNSNMYTAVNCIAELNKMKNKTAKNITNKKVNLISMIFLKLQ